MTPHPWAAFWDGSSIAEGQRADLLDRCKTLIVCAVILDAEDFLVYNSVEFYLFTTKMHIKEHCFVA